MKETKNVFDLELLDEIINVAMKLPKLKGLTCSNCNHEMYILVSGKDLVLSEKQIDQLWKRGIWVV